jgi:methylated-DNA-protein-cysteine methyltransferase-like protein
MNNFQAKFDPCIWKVVSSIPMGQVMAYGEIARAAGYPGYSRMVSKAMGRCPGPLPWFRVVRSDRTLAFEYGSESYREQSQLLKLEGIHFEGHKVIAASPVDTLDRMLWGPTDEPPLKED